MQLIKEEKKYWEMVLCNSEKVSAEGDVIVPDVKPDVLKVLQVDARSVLTDKGIAVGGIYAQGKVYVNILYVADCDTDETGCIKTELDFRTKIDNSKINSDMKLKMSCDVTAIDFILLNSRKLSVKATVRVDYDVTEQKNIEIPCCIEDGECISKTVMLDAISAEDECGFTVRGSMEIPSGKASVKEIVKTDVRVLEREIKTLESKIVVNGILGVCTLYFGEDMMLDYCEGEIPFTEVFNIEELSEDDYCQVDLTIGKIDTELAEDSDSDIRIINVESVVDMRVRASRGVELEYVFDCYCPSKNTQLNYCDVEVREYIDRFEKRANERQIVRADENVPAICKVYNIVAEPEITKCTAQSGGVSVSGKVKLYILYLTDNPKCAVYSIKNELPFEYYYPCDNAREGMDCDISVLVENLIYNLNSKGEIEIKYTLLWEGRISRKITLDLICDAQESDKEEENDIVIYFVKKGDSLWSIGKRYGVRVDEIKSVNNLESDEILEGQKLLIPIG